MLGLVYLACIVGVFLSHESNAGGRGGALVTKRSMRFLGARIQNHRIYGIEGSDQLRFGFRFVHEGKRHK